MKWIGVIPRGEESLLAHLYKKDRGLVRNEIDSNFGHRIIVVIYG